MSTFTIEFKPTGQIGVVALNVSVAGAEPFVDEVNILTVDGRRAAVAKLCERYPALEAQEIEEKLAEESARMFRSHDVDAVVRAAERARAEGLLPFAIGEAYRRAVAKTRPSFGKAQMTEVEAARALGGMSDADEDTIVQLLRGDESQIRAAFREGTRGPRSGTTTTSRWKIWRMRSVSSRISSPGLRHGSRLAQARSEEELSVGCGWSILRDCRIQL